MISRLSIIEPLEDRTIAQSLGIVDQRIVIAVLVLQIGLQAVGNMLNPAAAGGIVEHVDHGAVNIGDEDSRLPTPDRPGAEDCLLADVMQSEMGAMTHLVLVAHGPAVCSSKALTAKPTGDR